MLSIVPILLPLLLLRLLLLLMVALLLLLAPVILPGVRSGLGALVPVKRAASEATKLLRLVLRVANPALGDFDRGCAVGDSDVGADRAGTSTDDSDTERAGVPAEEADPAAAAEKETTHRDSGERIG